MERFILWDPKDGEVPRGGSGEYLTTGLVGVLTPGSLYLGGYPVYLDGRTYADLDVHERCRARYSLSGSSGEYLVVRIS